MKKTGREYGSGRQLLVHEMFSERSLVQVEERHPEACFGSSECTEAVLALADTWANDWDPELRENEPPAEFIVRD